MSNKKIRVSLENWFREYNREPLNDTEAAISAPTRNVDRFDDPHAAWRAYKRIVLNGGFFDAMTLWDFIKWLFAETKGECNERK